MNLNLLQKEPAKRLLIGFALLLFTALFIFVNRPIDTTASANVNTETYLPTILNSFDSTLGIPLFGVQTYGDTSITNKYYDTILDSRASWVRTNISWNGAEPTNGAAYNWTQVDASFAISVQPNIHIIATIDDNPAWAAIKSRGPITPTHMNDFTDFVGALVERYDGDGVDDAPGSPVITYWEFYNEPDHGEGSWGDDGDAYAAMLQAVYPIVKQANPNAKVVLGGLAYDAFYEAGGPFNRAFLDDVLSAGGDYFDVMNFHFYPAFSSMWTPLNGPGLLQKTEVIRSKLTDYGYADREIIITESGWFSSNGSTPAIQSYYVIELLTQSYAADVNVMIWWMLYDPGSGYENHGLVTNDTPPVVKSSLVAYQTAVSELANAHFQRTWTAAETGSVDIELFEFNDNVNNRTIYVTWVDPVDSNLVSTITIAGQQATTVKVSGTTVVEKQYTGVNGQIVIPVSAQPIFIRVSK